MAEQSMEVGRKLVELCKQKSGCDLAAPHKPPES